MSDGGDWNEPAAPQNLNGPWEQPSPTFAPPTPVPITGYGPQPLPLPPGAPGGRRSGVRTGLLVALGVAGALAICGLAASGIIWFASSGPFGGMDSGSTGVMVTEWADSGRHAVVEYVSAGADGTSSVVAWDSQTGESTKVDGYRVVATEPSSTQVWLTRAVSDTDDIGESDSPWQEPSWGGAPEGDGPGILWRWDTASPGTPPSQVASGSWEPWTGSAGSAAVLFVDPSVGLWPNRLKFRSDEGTVTAKVPGGEGTFLPIGWSPSGRYFAVIDPDTWSGPGSSVTILNAADGTVAASYETTDGADLTSVEHLDGAAWDAASDTLWVATSTSNESDDGSVSEVDSEDLSLKVALFSLEASGTRTPLRAIPSSWSTAINGPRVLGGVAGGVLVAIEAPDAVAVWKTGNGTAAEVGSLSSDDFALVGRNVYTDAGGLLVQHYGSGIGFRTNPEDGEAAVVGLDGKNPRTIWPKP